MCKHALLLCAFAATAAACAPAAGVETRIRVAIDGGAPVDVPLSLSAERASQQARWTEAVAAAVRHHVRILGAPPAGTVTIVDRDVHAPLWSSHRGMAVEAAVAHSVAASFWHGAIRCDADGQWFVDGLARYTAIGAVAAQNQGERESAFVGLLEVRSAGGFLPWVVPAAVPAWTAGRGLSAIRAHPRVDPDAARSAAERNAIEMKTALAMQTLSNWVGAPLWEATLRSFVSASRGRCSTWRDLRDAARDVTGLDLSWFFDEAFGSGRTFDYGVDEFASGRAADVADRYHTEIVVRRYGDAVFSGTSEPPIEPFESGRGVELVIRFADGTVRLEHWDGRAASHRFTCESASRAESVTVDPRQLILLDTRRTNNSLTAAPRAAAAATRWSVRWTAWLQHLLLSYGSLV